MKNIISAAACVAVATCALSLLAARDREVFPEPELRLPKMSAPPKIDGVVDEGENLVELVNGGEKGHCWSPPSL